MTEEEYYDRIFPADKEKVKAAMQKLIDGQSDTAKVEYQTFYDTDKWTWIESYGVVSRRDETGKPVVLVGAFQEIRKRKRMEQELRTAKEQA